MTSNRNLKRRVRSRAAKTGESYAAARRHIHSAQWGDAAMPGLPLLKLATAQVIVRDDPRDAGQLRQCGRDARELMRQAGSAGARIIHFPEGATCSPSNRILSVTGPAEVGPADWDRADWQVLRHELAAIARLAGELRLWTVLGSVHRLTPPHRPHNSMYVISDHGELVTRYDERLLSNTKLSFMYAPGSGPVIFDVDGLRFGCAMGIEVHYPEVFAEYERLDVDGVLISTGPSHSPAGTAAFATEAQAHAATNSLWVSFAAPSGTIAPDGTGPPSAKVTGNPRWPSPISITGRSPSTSRSPRPARGAAWPAPASTTPIRSPTTAATTAPPSDQRRHRTAPSSPTPREIWRWCRSRRSRS
jgi:predicted amidohydrolase